MPRRLITCGGDPVSGSSRKRTLPPMIRTRPMIAFSVVDLPAPLRPSSETTSPSRALSRTPCSTWLGP